MQQVFLLFLAPLVSCNGSTGGSTSDCLRPLDWRDPLVVEEGTTGDVVVVEDCENDLTVTSVELIGSGWEGDLPEVGDLIDAGTWTVSVFNDLADNPGCYTGELSIEADGLDPEPAKPLQYLIEGDTGDDGSGC